MTDNDTNSEHYLYSGELNYYSYNSCKNGRKKVVQ